MRLSEAIAIGRTLVRNCVAGGSTRIHSQPGDGCVLDMAALAVGKRNWQEAKTVWGWLRNFISEIDYRTYEEEIFQRFDHRVMASMPTMTLDQLIDWVRSVEPAEPEQVLEAAVEESFCEQVT